MASPQSAPVRSCAPKGAVGCCDHGVCTWRAILQGPARRMHPAGAVAPVSAGRAGLPQNVPALQLAAAGAAVLAAAPARRLWLAPGGTAPALACALALSLSLALFAVSPGWSAGQPRGHSAGRAVLQHCQPARGAANPSFRRVHRWRRRPEPLAVQGRQHVRPRALNFARPVLACASKHCALSLCLSGAGLRPTTGSRTAARAPQTSTASACCWCAALPVPYSPPARTQNVQLNCLFSRCLTRAPVPVSQRTQASTVRKQLHQCNLLFQLETGVERARGRGGGALPRVPAAPAAAGDTGVLQRAPGGGRRPWRGGRAGAPHDGAPSRAHDRRAGGAPGGVLRPPCPGSPRLTLPNSTKLVCQGTPPGRSATTRSGASSLVCGTSRRKLDKVRRETATGTQGGGGRHAWWPKAVLLHGLG